jgi:hypothetical protein
VTPFQHLWVALCAFGPAITLGVLKAWWVGVIAYVVIFVLNFVLGWGMLSAIPPRFLEIWGYVKNLVVGLIVLLIGLWTIPNTSQQSGQSITTAQALFLLALAFSCALPGFVFAARRNGWPYGQIFSEGKIPVGIAIGCIAFLLGQLVSATVFGDLSLLWFLYAALAYFAGGSAILALLGRWSGLTSLIVAPALTITSAFFTL